MAVKTPVRVVCTQANQHPRDEAAWLERGVHKPRQHMLPYADSVDGFQVHHGSCGFAYANVLFCRRILALSFRKQVSVCLHLCYKHSNEIRAKMRKVAIQPPTGCLALLALQGVRR
jgi:hypothetical protein